MYNRLISLLVKRPLRHPRRRRKLRSESQRLSMILLRIRRSLTGAPNASSVSMRSSAISLWSHSLIAVHLPLFNERLHRLTHLLPIRMGWMIPKLTRCVLEYTIIMMYSRKLQSINDWDRYTIVGTSKQVFKDYLRLTSVCTFKFSHFDGLLTNPQEPNPAQIRPLPVLQQTLEELKAKWRDLSKQSDTQYNWICSQFKSLRQDLVVCRATQRLPLSTG
jgi:hypothetical protein